MTKKWPERVQINRYITIVQVALSEEESSDSEMTTHYTLVKLFLEKAFNTQAEENDGQIFRGKDGLCWHASAKSSC